MSSERETTIAVEGEHFYLDVQTAFLDPRMVAVNAEFELFLQRQGQTPRALYDVVFVSNTELSARVPAGLAEGLYDLALNAPLGTAESLPEALVVVAESSAIMGGSCEVAADCAADPCVTVPICLAGACVYAKDSDADGYIDAACGGDDCDDDPGACGNACFPGNAEVCDRADNDCDGRIDESSDRVGWRYRDWSSRRQLVFDNTGQSENLLSFPVLVVLRPANFDYAMAKPDGTDLRFVDQDRVTELTYHIEAWSSGGLSYVWVNVPLIDAGSPNDLIWMYYDNPQAADVQNAAGTYDSQFVGVWHLSEVSGNHFDASSYANDGEPVGGLIPGVAGMIGPTCDFAGIDNYVRVADDPSLTLTIDWTIETWVNFDTFIYTSTGWQALVSKDVSATQIVRPASLWIWQDRVEVWYTPLGAVLRSNQALTTGTWYHLAATYSAGTLRIFIDGVLDNSIVPTSGPDTASYDLYFGQRGDNTNSHFWFDGRMDEVRLSTVGRSEDWLRAQFLSMTDIFITYGAEERVCPP